MRPPDDWMQDANCRGTDPETFYPPTCATPTDALRLCARCIVRDDCLTYALQHESPSARYGIWGGTTPQQRQRLHITSNDD